MYLIDFYRMMKVVLNVILAFSCVLAYENSDEFINEINSKQNLWKAGRNFHKDIPMSRIRSMVNKKTLTEEDYEKIPVMVHHDSIEIPESFDARTQWHKCKTIGLVTDQGSCIGCWAITVAGIATDRYCIHSDGKLQPVISAQYLLNCEPTSQGCYGGYPSMALEYWTNMGLVTGGTYGSNYGCQPYLYSPCEHHINGSKPLCPDPTEAPDCVKTCENSINYEKDLYYGESFYVIQARNETQMQLEIMKNGPVVASITLWSDFIHYKSGVYKITSGGPIGMHNVKVIGWGVENGTKYWQIVNSWNEEWGDKGMMKVLRGVNECAIETFVTAGLPKLP